ncbi:MAG: hypothetical protein AB4058_20365 [Microcystaceae cyanobacterium]
MTVKERIMQEIEDSSPLLLEEFLDFIIFTKQRRPALINQPKQEKTEQPYKSQIKAFEGLFDNVPPVSEEIDPDQEKWEYLKEKHNL